MPRLSRRQFLALTTSAAGAFALRPTFAATDSSRKPIEGGTSFFVIGDTHYLAEKTRPTELDAVSRGYTSRLIDVLNRLPGAELPATVGGGTLAAPRGVIHAGDLIDSGDKTGGDFATMQHTELAAFTADFGLNGGDGRLKLPVREIHGNHDSPHGTGIVVPHICERNRTRAGLASVSPNGLHYSWDWDGVHFINLGITVGRGEGVPGTRRFAPLESLDFLIADLAAQVGNSGRSVVITHHVDVARYCGAVDPAQAGKTEWDPAEVHAYHDALHGFRIAAILYGHTHTRRIFPWDGTPPTAKTAAHGIPVFNTDNVAHYHFEEQAFLHLQVTANEVVAREYATEDGWLTADWTPQTWRFPLEEA